MKSLRRLLAYIPVPRWLRRLWWHIQLAYVYDRLFARIEAMDSDLDDIAIIAARVKKNGRVINELEIKALSLRSAINTGNGAQPITGV